MTDNNRAVWVVEYDGCPQGHATKQQADEERIANFGEDPKAKTVRYVAEVPLIPCEFPDCLNEAAYEGWYRRRDPLLGTPSGHIVYIAFCEEHKTHPYLCANEPKPNKQGG